MRRAAVVLLAGLCTGALGVRLALASELTCDVQSPDVTVASLSSCGAAALRGEDYERAQDLFGRARELDPSDPGVVQSLASVSLVLGFNTIAGEHLESLAKLRPDDLAIELQLAVLRTARAPQDAAAIWRPLRERAAARSADPLAARVQELSGSVIRAVEGGSGPDFLHMARALPEEQCLLAALLLEKAGEGTPTDPVLPYERGRALARCGHLRLAFEALRSAAALPPAESIQRGAIDYEAGRVALEIGRHMDALRYLERARRAQRALPNLERMLGRAYAQVGDRAAAEREYTACLSLAHNTATSRRECRDERKLLASLPARTPASERTVTALARAHTNASTAVGSAYAQAADTEIDPRLMQAVRTCVSVLAAGGWSRPRSLLVRVAADGTVDEVLQPSRVDAEPLCFASQLRGAPVATPPAPGWWLEYKIAFGDACHRSATLAESLLRWRGLTESCRAD